MGLVFSVARYLPLAGDLVFSVARHLLLAGGLVFLVARYKSTARRRVANYSDLPTDMLEDILFRLPADEVCRRMRLVCRTWRSVTYDPLFTREHASRHPAPPQVIVVVGGNHHGEAAEIRAVDLHGKVIKRRQIRQPIGPLSIHGDLLCASHGWGMTSVVDMVTGADADVSVDPRKKVNGATPYCLLGHVPATGEYKVLRIQADHCRRQRRQTCDVMTMGGGDAGRWRRRTCPPMTLFIDLGSSSFRKWHVAVAGGLAYFLVTESGVEADRLAVFDLATEEWKPATLQGPMSASLIAADIDHELIGWQFRNLQPHARPLVLLRWNVFKLARLGESLVVVHCNGKKDCTELWFLEAMVDETTASWSRRYKLEGTTFGGAPYGSIMKPIQYRYPLAVLDDGRILVWVDRTTTTSDDAALRTYDPETCTWTDLPTPTAGGGSVVGTHHGNLRPVV